MKGKTIPIFIFISIVLFVPVLSSSAYFIEDWSYLETKYVPFIYYRVYDPAGTDSYQEVTETFSTKLALKFEAEAGGTGGSTTTTISVSLETGVRTVDTNNDPSVNGIGKGDSISGYIAKCVLRITGYTCFTRTRYYNRVTSTEIVSILWTSNRFDVKPNEFKTLFGYDAPSKIGSTPAFSFNSIVGSYLAKTYKCELELEQEASLTLGVEFNIPVGVKVSMKATTTFTVGYKISTTVYLKDTTSMINHTLCFSGEGSLVTSGNVIANSIIPWFAATYL